MADILKGNGMTIRDVAYGDLDEGNVLENNEIQSNVLVGFSMSFFGILVFLFWCMERAGLLWIQSPRRLLYIVAALAFPAFACHYTRGRRIWLKYFMLADLVLVVAGLNLLLGFCIRLLIVVPTVLACRYFSGKLLKVIAILTAVTYTMSSFVGAFFGTCDIDLNYYVVDPGTTLEIRSDLWDAIYTLGVNRTGYTTTFLVLSLLPEICIYSMIAVACIRIAQKGREMVLEQAVISRRSARLETELNLANNIQTHMLPTIFPPSVGSREIEMFASMDPAKSVGGDFYDFFMVDEKNMAMVIADVSGKGIPAALFMVITKTLLKNEVNMGGAPGEVFARVNHLLFEGNEDDMFVTAWMGILNTETGVLTYVNAGHNPPLIRLHGTDPESRFTYLKERPGFVLGGMDGLRYRQREIIMQPGDSLFLYTDGATEARNEEEAFYGSDRFLNYMNEHRRESPEDLLRGVREDIRRFTASAEQFDDITLMSVKYLAYQEKDAVRTRSFPADLKHLDDVMQFAETELEKAGCAEASKMQIALCVEKIFANIAEYAYPRQKDDVQVNWKQDGNEVTVRFIDHGIPFDPLEERETDRTAAAEDRAIGGPGFSLVREKMDDVEYEYRNGRNILTIRKRI